VQLAHRLVLEDVDLTRIALSQSCSGCLRATTLLHGKISKLYFELLQAHVRDTVWMRVFFDKFLPANNSEIRGLLVSTLFTNVLSQSAKDPMDRVYAVHGILDVLDFESAKPDYDRPNAQVFEEFVFSSITYANSASILTSFDLVFNISGWPSWVPDLTQTTLAPEKNLWGDEYPLPEFRSSFRLIQLPGTLTLERVVFGFSQRIFHTFPISTPNDVADVHFLLWFKELFKATRTLPSYPNGNSAIQAFLR
jgi:hypothetical protein